MHFQNLCLKFTRIGYYWLEIYFTISSYGTQSSIDFNIFVYENGDFSVTGMTAKGLANFFQVNKNICTKQIANILIFTDVFIVQHFTIKNV